MADHPNKIDIGIDALNEATDWLVIPAPGEYFVSVHVKGMFTGTLTPQTKGLNDANAEALDDGDDEITAPNHYNFVLHGPVCFRLKATSWSSGTALGAIHR